MGINKLSTVYTYAPDAIGTISFSSFNGHRIAIDAGVWMSSAWSTASKYYIDSADLLNSGDGLPEDTEIEVAKNWLKEIQRFINKFLFYGITPVFILDGQAPEDKNQTREKRREDRERNHQKLFEYRQEILNVDPLLRNETMLMELRKKTRNAQIIPFPDADIFPSILRGAGIPCLQAKGEAERLCSALCREGWVSAVYSTDTDNLAHGCPLLLKKILGDSFEYVHLPKLLGGLELDHRSFVDLCIMSGCDYNKNMPRIAIGKSYPLIKTFGLIDNLPEKYHIECLRHERCRELFSEMSSSDLCENVIDENSLNLNLDTFKNGGREILEAHSIDAWIGDLLKFLFTVPVVHRSNLPFNPVRPRLRIIF